MMMMMMTIMMIMITIMMKMKCSAAVARAAGDSPSSRDMTGRDNETFWEGEEIHYRCREPRREGVVLQPGLQGPEGGQVHLHPYPAPFNLNPSP